MTSAQAFADSKFQIPNQQSAVPNPKSDPGLWSELRFRLRRPLGILTGTIDKLLITPAAKGDGVDVEIIDFKTNRFKATNTTTHTRAEAVSSRSTVAATSRVAKIDSKSGQAAFDFESVFEEEVIEEAETIDPSEAAPSISEQIQTTAEDYQLQMQAYALALSELLSVSTRSGGEGVGGAILEKPLKINSLRATLHFIDPNVEISLPSSMLTEDVCAKTIDDAMVTIAFLDGTLDADQFPPLPATHCRICNYRDMCPAGREWLRAVNNSD